MKRQFIFGLLSSLIGLSLLFFLLSAVGVAGARSANAVNAAAPQGPFIGQPVYPAVVNIDVRTLPQLGSRAKPKVFPLLQLHKVDPKGLSDQELKQLAEAVDPAAQTALGEPNMPTPDSVFAGLDFAGWGAGWPPDTNGDVGPTYYIQTVNTSIGIFTKTTGVRVAAFTFDDFFTGTGTPCDANNNGDPVVLYDPLADRWIITDFSWTDIQNGPYYECIAVSQTSDPVSGGWYMYGFRADDAAHPWLNDYPKLGVWPDGYYMSANMFDCLNSTCSSATFQGVRVWALDRTSMLSGGALNNVHFDIPSSPIDEVQLPSNLRGDLPPAGSPNFFAAIDDGFGGNDVLHIWKFHVDWTTPLSSTYTGPTDLVVTAFTLPTGNVPQGGGGEGLDSLGDRLMMQLQYRNINGVESLWANHTVASGGVMGVRWYEVRDPNGTPAIYQQGTYQPDSNYRWMGSLAVDHNGNMAVGYSVSSSSMNPAIRYAGRLAADPLGTLAQGEATLFAGTGSQTGGFNRWGDYSAMTVDPVDDCTFWYTNEVYTTTGSNWQTRIGSFKYPVCSMGPSGTLTGTVSSAASGVPIVGAQVVASASPTQTNSTSSGAGGIYSMLLSAGTYTVTGSAFGYQTASVGGVSVVSGTTTTQNLALNPLPVLTVTGVLVSGGDGDAILEPGETANLSVGVGNIGFLTATSVSGVLTSANVLATVLSGSSLYANIAPSATVTNTTLFQVKLDGGFVCGQLLQLNLTISTTQGTFLLVVNVPTSPLNLQSTYVSTDVPKSVPDNSPVGVTSLLTVTDNYALTDVNVTLSISHTWDSDLNIYLVSPAGITVELSTANGGSGDNYINTTFDDEAATSIAAGAAPFTGSYKPEGLLSTLDGQNSAGTWKLFVRDSVGADVGTVTAWRLALTAAPVCIVNVPLTINVVGSGTVSQTPLPPYGVGDVVTLTANAATGWSFSSWSGDLGSTTNPVTITLTGDKVVTATFTHNPASLTVNVVGNGTVGQNPLPPYGAGDVVTLTANAATGWSFSSWSGDLGGTTNPVTITLNIDKVVTATFTHNPASLTVNVVGNGTVGQNPLPPYLYGEVVTLTANAVTDWSFAGWTGDLTGVTNPDAITLNGNKVVTANFTLNCVLVSGADFSFTPALPKVGQVVSLTGTVSAGTAPITYTWNFGDSGTGSGQNVAHAFPLTATMKTYTVTMTTANACTAPTATQKAVTVTPYKLYLPVVMRNTP